MTEYDITRRLRAYIMENFLYMRRDFAFTATDSLLGRGIIDSMGVIELITFVENEFGIAVGDGEITEEHFGTLEAITRFVAGKLAATSAA